MRHMSERGFTLVEMAIVLVIIGIILAGVMKGRDIVRGAQVKQFSQQFAQKWGTICQTYYDKTGQQINDGAINSGVTGPDGFMDGQAANRANFIVDRLNEVGIEPCTMVKSKLISPVATQVSGGMTVVDDHCGDDVLNVFQTIVEGEYAGNSVITVDLVGRGYTFGTGATAETFRRNSVIFYRVPVDVAVGLDTAIDGKEDGESGNCINIGSTFDNSGTGYARTLASSPWFPALPGSTTAAVAKAWPDASAPATHLTNVALILDY